MMIGPNTSGVYIIAVTPFTEPGDIDWEKLFGKPASAQTLAYAGAETGSLGSGHGVASGLYDRSTAVYDITAHKVYLPDGTALEAHSGLGALLDDPRHADVKMRGVTPPAVYDLQPREALFHGVEALRLIPELSLIHI